MTGVDAGRARREPVVAVVGIDEQRVGVDVAGAGEAALDAAVGGRRPADDLVRAVSPDNGVVIGKTNVLI